MHRTPRFSNEDLALIRRNSSLLDRNWLALNAADLRLDLIDARARIEVLEKSMSADSDRVDAAYGRVGRDEVSAGEAAEDMAGKIVELRAERDHLLGLLKEGTAALEKAAHTFQEIATSVNMPLLALEAKEQEELAQKFRFSTGVPGEREAQKHRMSR